MPNKYRSRLYVCYETPVPRQMMLRFELSIYNGKRCKERVKKESKCDLRVFDPIGRNLLNEINRAEEWLPVEEQEVPNEMGNTVYLPLFSVIWSFIAVRSVAFFSLILSLVESRAKHLSFALFLIAVMFRLQRCDQDSYITGHSDTMHVHTSGHMWIFLNESFIFCFTVAFNRTGKKNITGYFCVRRTFIGSQRANKQLKYNDKRSDTNEKNYKCLVTGANRVVLFYNWSLQFYSLHFTFAGACIQTGTHVHKQIKSHVFYWIGQRM